MDAFNWRCTNCYEFHNYGRCQYYDQGWVNSGNPQNHQDYGEYEDQPFDQEQPHQSGGQSLEDIVEKFARDSINVQLSVASFIKESRNHFRVEEAPSMNLETPCEKISRKISDESQVSFSRLSNYEEYLSLEEEQLSIVPESELVKQCEEPRIEEDEDCEVIEENLFSQVLEEEKEESPQETSTENFELESNDKMSDKKEEMVDIEVLE